MSRIFSHLVRTAALLGIMLVVLLPAGTASAQIWKVSSDSSIDPMSHLTEFENRVVVEINTARRAHRLKPVRYFDSCIDRFSERWGRHLAGSGLLVHRRQSRILRACHLSWVGEALVRGTGISPAHMVRAWLDSPPHRAILLKRRANHAGVGVVLDRRGRYVGVLNFGDSR
jgi:uncharacterized protein YkwD